MIYPNRHKNHILESASERYVKYHLPKEWTFTKPSADYGVDLLCEVVIENEIRGYEFGIQLKAKRTEKNWDSTVIKGLKRSTINLWLNSIKPIMIIVFIEDEEKAYWSWINESSFDLTKDNEEFQLKISKGNIINSTSSIIIGNYIKDYNLRMLKLKNLPNVKEDYGWQLYLERKYNEALPYLKKTSPTLDVLNAIAICYFKSFQYQKALIWVNEAIEIDNKNIVVLSNKASILIELGSSTKNDNLIREGINIIEALIENGEITNNTYFNYGNALMALGFYEEAKEVFRVVLSEDINKAEAWKNLGMANHNLGLFEEEIECYDKSLIINPFLIEALSSKAVTLFLVYKDYFRALDIFMKVVEIDDTKRYKFEYPYIDFYISECHHRIGNIDKAIHWNTIGLKNNPSDDLFLTQKLRLLDNFGTNPPNV